MADEVLRFNVARSRVPVELVSADGTAQQYYMQKMDGNLRDEYLNEVDTHCHPDGTIKDHKGLTAALLRRVMFHDGGAACTLDEIQSWPPDVQDALWNEARRRNGFSSFRKVEPEKEQAAKN